MIKKTLFQRTLILFFAIISAAPLMAKVVYLKPLKGQEHQIGSLLNWSTSIELNNQVFIVEKSLDGVDYQAIGEVESVGDINDENSYRFLDVGVNEKVSYYRLRQVDKDGTASLSQTILLKKKLTNNYMILAMSKTLTNSTFTLSVDSTVDDEVRCMVKSQHGEMVQNYTQELYYGMNEITINLENEKEGTYFIILKVNNEREQVVVRKVDDEIKKKENVASKKQSNGG